MRHLPLKAGVLGAQTLLVTGFAIGLSHKAFPLGVPGEWEWLRLAVGPNGLDLFLATVGVAIYAGLAGVGFSLLKRRRGGLREIVLVSFLALAAFLVQGVVTSGTTVGYGLEKWIIALHQRGSSGYFSVASTEVRDLRSFLADYPSWIKKQDPLHIGTHPPGLIVVEYLLLKSFETGPGLIRTVDDFTPRSVAMAAKVYECRPPLRPEDRATLVMTGFLVMIACSSTVIPLYALARTALKAEFAWAVAVVWPLVASAILFQPTADAAFSVWTTLAMALASATLGQSPGRGVFLALLTGVVLAVGMQFSLVFLPVGLIVGLVILWRPKDALGSRLILFVSIGLGFMSATGLFWWLTKANPFVIWWWNQKNHARFYTTYPRSYVPWVIENGIELAVGIGLPAAMLGILAAIWAKQVPRPAWITVAVLAFLTLSGKNLSEVGRLWIPFMPALLVGAGFAMEKLEFGPRAVAWIVFLTGAQTLALEAVIQFVYPV